ncbi:TPA: hypothetical protein ACOEFM_002029 [Enterobacter roggenkampii]
MYNRIKKTAATLGRGVGSEKEINTLLVRLKESINMTKQTNAQPNNAIIVSRLKLLNVNLPNNPAYRITPSTEQIELSIRPRMPS